MSPLNLFIFPFGRLLFFFLPSFGAFQFQFLHYQTRELERTRRVPSPPGPAAQLTTHPDSYIIVVII